MVREGVRMPWAPATKMAESPLLQELRESVAKETLAFTFACGGSIPIIVNNTSTEPTHDNSPAPADPEILPLASSRPVDIRWDPHDETLPARHAKITFPLAPATEGNLDQLIKDMQPATFGKGGQDVYDESYRKATKLDPDRFSTTFNPYELGIVDVIAQTLLPTLRHAKQTRSVRAELYKLNIYSSPSGKFKAHVDTPRSEAQFGSLVICLPLDHQGGALEVRHNNKTVTFDWSTNATGNDAPPSISWAAFYSDCEHEVLEVTQGHRLTLTYNLYCVRGNGQLGGNCPILDPTHLPLYKTVFNLLHDADGWKEGGRLGYHCNHVYPHTTKSKLNFLAPDNLKGADMLMYEIFRSMGLKVAFRPTVSDLRYSLYEEVGEKLVSPQPVVGQSLDFQIWTDQLEDNHEECFDEFTGRSVYGPPLDASRGGRWIKSQSQHYIDFTAVHWLNDFGHEEPQVSFVAYGNQATGDMIYSSLALVVEIPPGGAANADG